MPVVKWANKIVSRAQAGGMTMPETDKSIVDNGSNTKNK